MLIPQGFVFSTPEGLVERLSVAPGDEFESTKEFKARAAAKVDESIAFLPIPDSLIYYDADVKAFIAFTYPMPIRGALKGPYGVMLSDVSKSGESYKGENAMGAKVSVIREDKHIIGVGLRDDETTDIGYPELPVRSDSARTLKARIKALLAISPRQGSDGQFVLDLTDRIQPTITRRRDTNRRISTILASRIEIWFYDDSTRKVLRKVSAKVVD